MSLSDLEAALATKSPFVSEKVPLLWGWVICGGVSVFLVCSKGPGYIEQRTARQGRGACGQRVQLSARGWNRLCGKLLNWGIDHTPSATTTRKLPWKTQRKLEKLGRITFDDLQSGADAELQWDPKLNQGCRFHNVIFKQAYVFFVLPCSPRMLLCLITQSVREKTQSSRFVSVTRNTHEQVSSSITEVKRSKTERSVYSLNPNLLPILMKGTVNKDVFWGQEVEQGTCTSCLPVTQEETESCFSRFTLLNQTNLNPCLITGGGSVLGFSASDHMTTTKE